MPDNGDKLRLNQAIAMTGLCSRRKADELIQSGKVKVNGTACLQFHTLVDPESDELEVDGKPLSFKRLIYVALNKPPGVVTTLSDEQGRTCVNDLLPKELRHLKPVGRLDMYSEGLLLLTNDGQLALKLTHPSQHQPKLYRVSVKGEVKESHLKRLAKGLPLEDGMTLPAKTKLLSCNNSYSEVEITLIEGRNRQLRRMFAYLGYKVVRLVRHAIGRLQLGQMEPGTWRYLTLQEVADLKRSSKE